MRMCRCQVVGTQPGAKRELSILNQCEGNRDSERVFLWLSKYLFSRENLGNWARTAGDLDGMISGNIGRKWLKFRSWIKSLKKCDCYEKNWFQATWKSRQEKRQKTDNTLTKAVAENIAWHCHNKKWPRNRKNIFENENYPQRSK